MLNLTRYEDAAQCMEELAGDDNVSVLIASDNESQLIRFFGHDECLTFSAVMTAVYQMFRVLFGSEWFTAQDMDSIKQTMCECMDDMNSRYEVRKNVN